MSDHVVRFVEENESEFSKKRNPVLDGFVLEKKKKKKQEKRFKTQQNALFFSSRTRVHFIIFVLSVYLLRDLHLVEYPS